jgi:nicotinamide riboside kinase
MELLLERKGIMRIGITGAQSVGKTTLLNALRSEKLFKDYVICDEVTRRVKGYGLPINEEGTDNTQRLIMNEHIVNVFMNGNMLTDRTALDGLVYSAYLYNKNQISANTLKYVREVFNKVWHSYDYVFYIEPEFEIVDDGVRSVNKQFRDEIAELFEYVIEKENLSMLRVKGSVRNRVNTIIDHLEGR